MQSTEACYEAVVAPKQHASQADESTAVVTSDDGRLSTLVMTKTRRCKLTSQKANSVQHSRDLLLDASTLLHFI